MFEGGPTWPADLSETKKNKAEFITQRFSLHQTLTLIEIFIRQNAPMEFIINLLCLLRRPLEQQTPAIRQPKPANQTEQGSPNSISHLPQYYKSPKHLEIP